MKSDHSEIEIFFRGNRKILGNIRKTDILIIMGDLNVRIGKGRYKYLMELELELEHGLEERK